MIQDFSEEEEYNEEKRSKGRSDTKPSPTTPTLKTRILNQTFHNLIVTAAMLSK